jgi:hypothetical protein
VFRIGGDEFVVILMRASVRDAQEVGNRIRESLRLRKDFNQEVPLPVHCSIGIAPLSPKTSTPDTLMEEADRALYQAKEAKAWDIVYKENSIVLRWMIAYSFVGNFISADVTAHLSWLESETIALRGGCFVLYLYSFPISRTSAEAWLMFGRSACQPCGSRANMRGEFLRKLVEHQLLFVASGTQRYCTFCLRTG